MSVEQNSAVNGPWLTGSCSEARSTHTTDKTWTQRENSTCRSAIKPRRSTEYIFYSKNVPWFWVGVGVGGNLAQNSRDKVSIFKKDMAQGTQLIIECIISTSVFSVNFPIWYGDAKRGYSITLHWLEWEWRAKDACLCQGHLSCLNSRRRKGSEMLPTSLDLPDELLST